MDLQLDDSILKTIETAPDEEVRDARELILRIRRRDLYQVYTIVLFQRILSSIKVTCI